MDIRSKTREGQEERRVLTSMIVDTAVAEFAASHWSPPMFRSRYAELVGGWCVEHFQEYGECPRRAVGVYFERWAEANRDRDTAALIERLLGDLSDEYEERAETSNTQYELDLAGRYFNRARAARLFSDGQAALEAGDMELVRRRLAEFDWLQSTPDDWVDVLRDDEAMRLALEQSRESIVQFPGAQGEFFGDELGRDAFIAFLGPEKRGKCVSEDMQVLLADGRLRTIRQIVESPDSAQAVAYDERLQRFVPMPISQFWDNGEKECWEVTTRTGRRVVTTSNHQYLTPDGWRYLGDISPGGYIAVPKRVAFFGDTPLPEHELKFLAYMLAEGGCTRGQCTFTNTDPVLVGDFTQACRTMGFGWTQKGIDYSLRGCNDIRRRYPGALWRVSSKTKRIPDEVFSCPREQVAMFLRVFFSCDGHISGSTGAIELTLANRGMLDQVGHLLTRFGIVYRIAPKPVRRDGRVFQAWRLSIRDRENVELFLSEIGFIGEKQSRSRKAELVRMGRADGDIATGRRYLGSDVLWDEVISIRCVGMRKTYDLSIPVHHNFVANNCIVHNTWILLDLAWRAMLQRRKVAFFEIGDLSKNQILGRFAVRAAYRPRKAGKVQYPLEMQMRRGDPFPQIKYEERVYADDLDHLQAKRARQRILASRIKSEETYLRVKATPNGQLTAKDIESNVRGLSRRGWTPDVVCIAQGSMVLTDRGLVPIEKIRGSDRLWDGLNWVSHGGLVYKGVKNVTICQGLAATPDHLVWTTFGWRTLESCARLGLRIARTGCGGRAIRLGRDYQRGCAGAAEQIQKTGVRLREMLQVQIREMDTARQHQAGHIQGVPELYATETFPHLVLAPCAGRSAEMPEPQPLSLGELWGAGDRVSVSLRYGCLSVGDREFGWPAQEHGVGSHRERWSLRARQPEVVDASAELFAHQEARDNGQNLSFPSVVPACQLRRHDTPPVFSEGVDAAANCGEVALHETEMWKSPVWDIINAGPFHRFTVQGLLVHNCIDYADLIAPHRGSKDLRDATDYAWKVMRGISQEFHCLVVTATQANAASYDALTISRKHFSEDKRKLAHVTGIVGLSQTEEEKDHHVLRMNWPLVREAEYSSRRCVYLAQCLAVANPAVRSCFAEGGAEDDPDHAPTERAARNGAT